MNIGRILVVRRRYAAVVGMPESRSKYLSARTAVIQNLSGDAERVEFRDIQWAPVDDGRRLRSRRSNARR